MKLLKTSLFSAATTFVKVAAGFVANKVVASITGVAGVALVGQFLNFITIVLTFANGAINNGVIKYTAEYEDDEERLKTLLSTSLKVSIYCSVIIGAVLFITAPFGSVTIFHTDVYANVIRTLGVTIIFYSLNTLLISILNGKKQIKSYTIVNTAGSLIGLVFTLILVYFYKIEGALYALVLAQSIVFFVTLVLIIKSPWFKMNYFNQQFNADMAKKLSTYSLMAIVSAVTMPVAQILLRNMLIAKFGINSAGYWQGMMRVSDAYLLVITTSLSTYFLPKLASLKTDSELRNEILRGYKILMPIVLFGCILVYLMRFIIIKVLFTADFVEMEGLFVFQLLGDFFKIAAWIFGYLIIAKAMTRLHIIVEIVFITTYLLFGYFFVNIFGLNGITIAFAVNYFFCFLMMLVFFRKLIWGKNE